MEKFLLNNGKRSLPAPLGHVLVLFAVLMSFVLFNADGLSGAAQDIGVLFGLGGLPLSTVEATYELRSSAVLLLVAAVGATPLPKRLFERALKTRVGRAVLPVAGPVLLLGLFLLATAYLVDGSFNPFLYFRF